ELLSRRGITPQYDLIQVEGTVHEPAFRYRVSYQNKDGDEVVRITNFQSDTGSIAALGTGKSKKEAKQAAAKALIDKLTGSSFHDFPGAYVNEESQEYESNMVECAGAFEFASNEEEPTGNPIGWLQEMCMARRWPPPTYETETEKGLPHERQFTIACVVLKHREVGEGKSKKIAKRQAAQKMWQRLQDQPLEPSQMMALLDEDGNEELRQTDHADRYACLKDVSIPTLTKSQSLKVSQFHKALKSRAGKLLQQLQGISLSDRNINYTDLLDEIAKEQRFLVTYVDIDEKSTNNKFQCLVQLSTMPVAVCHGSGLTIQEAHAYAARNSLEYLKIMSKSYTE
uniref:DRBM domain-containing protein n=1 Tax=Anopheles maculatus TaxID=74869 RepID=A0A182T1H8_9DIPT